MSAALGRSFSRRGLLPQDVPRDIGAQFLAAHGAAGGALDRGAVLRRHTATLLPHVGGAVADADGGRESGGTFQLVDGSLEGFHGSHFVAHVREYAALTIVAQEPAPITAVSKFPERLKEARERADLSQAALAKKAGVSAGSIGNWEAGTRHSARGLLKLAVALGVSPEWLAGAEAEPSDRSVANSTEMSLGTLALVMARAMTSLSEEERDLIAQQVAHLLRRGPAERIAAAIDALAPVSVVIPPLGDGGGKDSAGHLQPVVRAAYRAEGTTKVGGGSAWDSTQPSSPGRDVHIPMEEPGSQPIHRVPGRPSASKRSAK